MDNKQLRAIGHHLKPIVTVAGSGLSETVLAEINRALNDHELVKLKVAIDDRELRSETIESLCETTCALAVQTIGKTALILRKSSKPNPKTSNLIRYLSSI